MATISFSPGDVFGSHSGHGIVLPDGQAFIIEGVGGRSGYRQKKDVIPAGSLPLSPVQYQHLNFEVKFALDAVKLAML